MEAIVFFWEQAGGLLRRLSLSGDAGNIAAWIIFILAGGSPLILWAILGIRKRAGRSDLLLLLISVADRRAVVYGESFLYGQVFVSWDGGCGCVYFSRCDLFSCTGLGGNASSGDL